MGEGHRPADWDAGCWRRGACFAQWVSDYPHWEVIVSPHTRLSSCGTTLPAVIYERAFVCGTSLFVAHNRLCTGHEWHSARTSVSVEVKLNPI
jgi:hypothetical protein